MSPVLGSPTITCSQRLLRYWLRPLEVRYEIHWYGKVTSRLLVQSELILGFLGGTVEIGCEVYGAALAWRDLLVLRDAYCTRVSSVMGN